MLPMTDSSDFDLRARQWLARHGARVTRARCAVLARLFASARPLSHHELELQLADVCDRVTLYRVLNWLVDQGMAHRVSAEDRVWRFSVESHADHRHAHFHCHGCGMVFCMDAKARAPAVPQGFQLENVEMTLRGLCPECVQ
jgi:Fur family ferric uptake transcriptional regulator